jgi:hypothetical protein
MSNKTPSDWRNKTECHQGSFGHHWWVHKTVISYLQAQCPELWPCIFSELQSAERTEQALDLPVTKCNQVRSGDGLLLLLRYSVSLHKNCVINSMEESPRKAKCCSVSQEISCIFWYLIVHRHVDCCPVAPFLSRSTWCAIPPDHYPNIPTVSSPSFSCNSLTNWWLVISRSFWK